MKFFTKNFSENSFENLTKKLRESQNFNSKIF